MCNYDNWKLQASPEIEYTEAEVLVTFEAEDLLLEDAAHSMQRWFDGSTKERNPTVKIEAIPFQDDFLYNIKMTERRTAWSDSEDALAEIDSEYSKRGFDPIQIELQ